MIVEYGRSCYSSSWHLFRDDPEHTVPGRYYFSAENAIHYPGLHNFGSRNWHDANWKYVQNLGEDLVEDHKYDYGSPPSHLPTQTFVGSLDCIEHGGLTSRQALEVVGGFPLACLGPDDTFPLWRDATSYARCRVQEFYVHIIVKLYLGDAEGIQQLVSDFISPTLTTTVSLATAELPGVVCIVSPDFAICVLSGTENYQQLALQAFQSIVRPTSIGVYSTLPLWYSSSTYTLELLRFAGVTTPVPIMVAGHSYGGAVALNVVARLRAANATLPLRYLTFGCPKIGDERFVALVSRCEGYNIWNDNDLVAGIPPSLASLLPVVPLFPLTSLTNYLSWFPPPNQIVQPDVGDLVVRGDPTLSTATLFDLVTRVVLGQSQEPIDEHRSGSYLLRIRKRCPLSPPVPLAAKAHGAIIWTDKRSSSQIGSVVWTSRPNYIFPVRGAIVWTDRPPHVPPSSDCTGAAEVELPWSVVKEIADGAQQWFRATVPSSGPWRVEFEWLESSGGNLEFFRGTDCSDLVTIVGMGGVAALCTSPDLVAEELVWWRVLCSEGASSYRLSFSPGVCP